MSRKIFILITQGNENFYGEFHLAPKNKKYTNEKNE